MTTKRLGILILAIAGMMLAGISSTSGSSGIASLHRDDSPAKSEKFGDPSTVATLPEKTRKQADLKNRSNNPSLNGPYRTITDMAGRRVLIPKTISKVLGTSPPFTRLVYVLAPDKLGGWIGSLSEENAKFIPRKYRDKPVFRWSQKPINYEAYIAARPDIVFVGGGTGIDLSMVNLIQEKLGTIPVVCVDNTTNAVGYAEGIRFMGNVLGVPDRAEELITYYQNVLNEIQTKIAAIPDKKRVRVYYAEGNNGLSTDPRGSMHSQLIEVCGGVNVAACRLTSGSGMTPVTIESVLMWKPDVIIARSREFTTQVYNDATWKKIPAVRNHRVHLVPTQPFNWFDRPPGVNRIVGIPWTAHLFYPGLFPKDWLRMKVKKFYSIYYHYELSDGDLRSLLNE